MLRRYNKLDVGTKATVRPDYYDVNPSYTPAQQLFNLVISAPGALPSNIQKKRERERRKMNTSKDMVVILTGASRGT